MIKKDKYLVIHHVKLESNDEKVLRLVNNVLLVDIRIKLDFLQVMIVYLPKLEHTPMLLPKFFLVLLGNIRMRQDKHPVRSVLQVLIQGKKERLLV